MRGSAKFFEEGDHELVNLGNSNCTQSLLYQVARSITARFAGHQRFYLSDGDGGRGSV